MKLYELCKSKPNIKINPANTKHTFGRQSFNRRYVDLGEKQVVDTHIQMSLNMPKSYVKSLQPEIKRPRAHIYEDNNRLPDPIKLQLPPGTKLLHEDGRNTTGRASKNQQSHESIFNQTTRKAVSPTVNDSVLEYADQA